MADLFDEQFKRRVSMQRLVCDSVSADILGALLRYLERANAELRAVENARDVYFEADKSARAELARQKATYCGLLDEAAKEVNSLESTCERLREALRLVLDELHEINLANSHGNKPRNPEMTVFAEVQGLAALAPSLPTKEGQ